MPMVYVNKLTELFEITQERAMEIEESVWMAESQEVSRDDTIFGLLFEMKQLLYKNRYKLYELNRIIHKSCE